MQQVVGGMIDLLDSLFGSFVVAVGEIHRDPMLHNQVDADKGANAAR
jgi:hypothetical protein